MQVHLKLKHSFIVFAHLVKTTMLQRIKKTKRVSRVTKPRVGCANKDNDEEILQLYNPGCRGKEQKVRTG